MTAIYPDVSQFVLDGVVYNVKDTEARGLIAQFANQHLVAAGETLSSPPSGTTNFDAEKIYVVSGSQTASENGWYYWDEDADAWIKGGVIGNFVDHLLEIEGAAAEVSAVNAKFDAVYSMLSEHVKACLMPVTPASFGNNGNWQEGVYIPNSGAFDTSRTFGVTYVPKISIKQLQKIEIGSNFQFQIGCFNDEQWLGYLCFDPVENTFEINNADWYDITRWNYTTNVNSPLILNDTLINFCQHPTFKGENIEDAVVTDFIVTLRNNVTNYTPTYREREFNDAVQTLKIYLSTDTTLKLPGIAADAEAVGQRIDQLEEDVETRLNEELTVLSNNLTTLESNIFAETILPNYFWRPWTLTLNAGGYSATASTNDKRISTAFLDFSNLMAIQPKENYKISVRVYNISTTNTITYLGYWNVATQSIVIDNNTSNSFTTDRIRLVNITNYLEESYPESDGTYKIKVLLARTDDATIVLDECYTQCLFTFTKTKKEDITSKTLNYEFLGTASNFADYWELGSFSANTGTKYGTPAALERYIRTINLTAIPQTINNKTLIGLVAEEGYGLQVFVYDSETPSSDTFQGYWDADAHKLKKVSQHWDYTADIIYIQDILDTLPTLSDNRKYYYSIGIKKFSLEESNVSVEDDYTQCNFIYLVNSETETDEPDIPSGLSEAIVDLNTLKNTTIPNLQTQVSNIKNTIPLNKQKSMIRWPSNSEVLNPYSKITFKTYEAPLVPEKINNEHDNVFVNHIDSIAHCHINTPAQFRNAYANNVRNFIGLRYHPSEPFKANNDEYLTEGALYSFANFVDKDNIVLSPNAEYVYNSLARANGTYDRLNSVHILGPGTLYKTGYKYPGMPSGSTGELERYPNQKYTDVIRNIIDHLEYRNAGGVIITHPHWTTEHANSVRFPDFNIEKFIENCLDFHPLVLGTDVIESGRFRAFDIHLDETVDTTLEMKKNAIFSSIKIKTNSNSIPDLTAELDSAPADKMIGFILSDTVNNNTTVTSVSSLSDELTNLRTQWFYCLQNPVTEKWEWHDGGSMKNFISGITIKDTCLDNQVLIDHILQKGKRCWIYAQGDQTARHGCNELLIPSTLPYYDMANSTDNETTLTNEQKSFLCLQAYRNGNFFAKYVGADNNTEDSGDPRCGNPADLKITQVKWIDNTTSYALKVVAENADGICIVLIGEDTEENGTIVSGIIKEDSKDYGNEPVVSPNFTLITVDNENSHRKEVIRANIPKTIKAVRAFAYQNTNYNNSEDTNWPYITMYYYLTQLTPFISQEVWKNKPLQRAALLEYLISDANATTPQTALGQEIKQQFAFEQNEHNIQDTLTNYVINYRFDPYRNIVFTNPIMVNPLTTRTFDDVQYGSDVI